MRKPTIKVGDVVCVYKDKAPRQLWSMGVVKSLITGRDGYHRGAVVRVRSGDRVVEMTRPLNRLYPVEVESQVREERQNRNTDFPITFVENAEQEQVSEQLTIKSKKGELFCLISFVILVVSFVD